MTSRSLTVLSYNIHKGFSATNLNHILPQIKVMLHQLAPDIVFLQEVIGEHEDTRHQLSDWNNNAQFEYLADQLWDHFAYGKNAVYQAGHHGNAILSKYPIIDYSNHDISTNRYERRGVLHATVENPLDHQIMNLFCTHFDLREKGRKVQVAKLIDLIEPYSNTPIVVAGDFNDFWHQGVRKMEQAGMIEVYKHLHKKLPKTFPTQFPVFSLDRIFCKNLKPLEAEILNKGEWAQLSDHAALYCRLEL